jgi:L-lactate permease
LAGRFGEEDQVSEVTLESYKIEERRMSVIEARNGLRAHLVVTVIVCVALVVINVFVGSEFPWSIFPVVGMFIGVGFHWYFAVHKGDEYMRRHQSQVEEAAEKQPLAA